MIKILWQASFDQGVVYSQSEGFPLVHLLSVVGQRGGTERAPIAQVVQYRQTLTPTNAIIGRA